MDEGHSGLDMTSFPLSAVVGNSEVVDAIVCSLCSPDVHTILICGPPGSGKTTMARGASGISGGRRTVELPLNATAEQVFGTVDIDEAISKGRRRVTDSLMRRAHGNILVADNINLLPKELMHGILDAVTTGIVRAELDGVSVSERCDTLMIATMDPAEAELDPAELDRFDICVHTESLDGLGDRLTVLRRGLEYEKDPAGFRRRFSEQESVLCARVVGSDIGSVSLPPEYLGLIAAVCASSCVEGHRGDVAVMNVARAVAAAGGLAAVDDVCVRRAVDMCLPHRHVAISHVSEPPVPIDDEGDHASEDLSDQDEMEISGTSASESIGNGGEHSTQGGGLDEYDGSQDVVFAVGRAFRIKDFLPDESRMGRDRDSGRRGLMLSKDSTGRCIGYMIPRGRAKDVALGATIRVAAPYQMSRDRRGLAIAISKDDLRDKVRVRRKGAKILFVVDGSGSMDADSRMVAVKGTILSVLNDAYKRRDLVGLVVFRGERAEEVLPLTRSVVTAYGILEDLPTGGRTPLVSGLQLGYDILHRYAEKGEEPVMIVLTDGWGNVGVDPNRRMHDELSRASRVISGSGIRTVIVDTEQKGSRYQKALELSNMLDADYVRLDEINADSLSASIMSTLASMEANGEGTNTH